METIALNILSKLNLDCDFKRDVFIIKRKNGERRSNF
jgi:hypothetical protein